MIAPTIQLEGSVTHMFDVKGGFREPMRLQARILKIF
jgi:hypothetical protein